MDQGATQAKQVAEDQSQAPSNSEKAAPKVPKPDEAKKLIKFMENHYDKFVARVQTFDEFYHAIFELIEMFCEERGQFQYKIPEKETLRNAYTVSRKHLYPCLPFFLECFKTEFLLPDLSRLELSGYLQKHHKSGGELKKEELVAISREVVGLNSFTFGKTAVEIAIFLFGAPVCAVVAKRVLPGLRWMSDDVVIPLATSGSVAYLINSKRL
ncbi:hypothetical protein PR202_ga08268 [Eleusine coracana subsp. coracana]|uniref:Uncharacterized protein n=1 Tax=Eleusine coracana subsp. coracana TaxID=191504 RepID=A0AAV5C1S6_ELECO|nr:hypothetical protein PR202_ga08268 [Eleusine coracana subsp. coracana]